VTRPSAKLLARAPQSFGRSGSLAQQPESGPLARLTHLWWGFLPAVVYQVSPRAGLCLTDGIHIATWRLLAGVGPPAAFAAGLGFGWFHPGFPLIWSQSVLFIAGIALVGTLSAGLGTWLVAGFAVGDFFGADHGWPAVIPASAPGVFGAELPEPLRLRLPLIIGYLLLLLLAARIPLFAKTLLADAVGGRFLRRVGRPLTAAALVGAHMLVTGALVWAWTRAVPVLIRPRFTWMGALAPPEPAYGPLQTQGELVIAVAVLVSALRMARQVSLASQEKVQEDLDRIQRPVLYVARHTSPPGSARRWLRAFGAGLVTTLLACGILANIAEAVFVFVGAVLLSAARSGVVRIPLGQWPGLVERLPLVVRLAVGWIVIQWLAAQLLTRALVTGGPQDLFRPFVVTMLVALVIVYLVAPAVDQTRSPGPEPAAAGMTAPRWPLLLGAALALALALSVVPHAAAAADCQEVTHCLANSIRSSVAALAGVTLLIGLFVAPEVFSPLLLVKGATDTLTGRDPLTRKQLDWTQRAFGVLPALSELGQELWTRDEATGTRQPRASEEQVVPAPGGGTFGDEVGPYEPEGPIQGQMNPDSCVAACCRMLHNSVTRGDVAAAMWRNAARVDETGGRLSDATNALRAANVPADLHDGMSVASLERATAIGPAIVAGEGHAVVVDRIADGLVYVRDPEPSGIGCSYAVPLDRFTGWWSGRAVVVADDDI
jgi:Peptidase C39 family